MMRSEGTIEVDGITYVISSPGPGVVVAHEPDRPNQVACLRWGPALRSSGDVVWMGGALDSTRAPREHQEHLEAAVRKFAGLMTENASPAAGTEDGRAAG